MSNRRALVTGGSRGLGRAIVEALAGEGMDVWAIARDAKRLDLLKQEVRGVQTRASDAALPRTAAETLREIDPDILVLNAGATPLTLPVHELTWEQFSLVWDTDVKATFHFGKEGLTMPMKPGSVVVIISSTAAIGGSPLGGSYAGAKRMQWFLAQYFQQEADRLDLGIRFVALIPPLIGTTDLGRIAVSASAARQGITEEAFLDRFGEMLTPEAVGRAVVSLVTDSTHKDGIAYRVTGQGLESLPSPSRQIPEPDPERA